MPTPTAVKISFWIFLLGAVLEVVAGVIILGAGITAAAAGDTLTIGTTPASGPVLIATGVIALVIVAVELLVLWKMKAGRNWARVLLTVLEVLSIIGVFTGTNGVGILAVIISVVAVVLMWLPTSNEYFKAASPRQP
ncbi:MAG: hypothetical protein JSS74_09990 [Actinobacteria bacterium]|nr:hypothetical protein [Actinomycetota bacterium]